jgi:hypothetical protein
VQIALPAEPRGQMSRSGSVRLLLTIPLVLSLLDAQAFGRAWIATHRPGPDIDEVVRVLRTQDLAWVNPPFGEHYWVEAALREGLKLSTGIRTWQWKGRTLPQPVREANRVGAPPGMSLLTTVNGIPVYAAEPGREYAAVAHADGSRTVCTASGTGGDIDVVCNALLPGTLEVKENSWSGWHARVDGRRVPLRAGQWLSVDLQGGRHAVQLRYRPADVPLGLALCAAGVVLAAWLWVRGDARSGSPNGAGEAPP